MTSWFKGILRPKRRKAEIPAELVAAIESFGVISRSAVVDEHGNREARPLSMSFLSGRAIYMDDHEALTRRMRSAFPDLDDRQVSRALTMIARRTREMGDDMEVRGHLLAGRHKSRRTSAWMRQTDDMVRW